MNNPLISKLKDHASQADKLRKQLGISGPGELIYWHDLSVEDEEMVVVVADGQGCASLSVVRGRYPFDYETLESESFATEAEAEHRAAEVSLRL